MIQIHSSETRQSVDAADALLRERWCTRFLLLGYCIKCSMSVERVNSGIHPDDTRIEIHLRGSIERHRVSQVIFEHVRGMQFSVCRLILFTHVQFFADE